MSKSQQTKAKTSSQFGKGSKVDYFFKVTDNGSTIPREIFAGIITFLTMAYILAVNSGLIGDVISV
jgi:AGZA family xanthine/uracil permease-like MFS transporter